MFIQSLDLQKQVLVQTAPVAEADPPTASFLVEEPGGCKFQLQHDQFDSLNV
jgi:hypothetical protein